MANNMNLLLTGGTGFLGSNLLQRFVAAGHRVVLLIRPSSDTWRIKEYMGSVRHCILPDTDLDALFQEESFDCIVHCATNYGRREVDITSILEANLVLPLQLLQLARKYKVGCFINTDTMLDKRVSNYSLSKSQFREWFKEYFREMTCVNVSLEHFYGPFDDNSKFVTFIIKSLLENVKKIELTKGEQKRDFVYIDDVVDAFSTILAVSGSLGNGFHSYEIGTGALIKIMDLVALVKKITGNSGTLLNFGALPYRENEVMESRVDIASIARIGWKPRITIEEGLLKTVRMEMERGKR